MGYAIKNILTGIKRERMVLLLILLCVCSSVVVLHFSYGLYQNYHIILEDGENDSKELQITVNDPAMVTKESLYNCLLGLPPETNHDIYMYMVRPHIPGITDQSDNRGWGSIMVRFSIRDGLVAPCEVFRNNITNNGALTSGVYFDAQQEARGDLVAIAGPTGNNDSCTDTLTTRMEGSQRWIEVQGKEYKVIGMQKMLAAPIIPFMSLDDDTPLNDSVLIKFNQFMTRTQYDTIRQAFENTFGNAVTVPDLDIPETEQRYLYRTILMICAAIALLAAANFAVLYQYLLEQRKKQIAIFRICGCKKSKTICIFLMECALLILPAYAVSVFGFVKLILPRCAKLYPYMEAAYRMEIYMAIFFIYMLVSLAVFAILIGYSIRKQSLASMKTGGQNV